jgi:hypothetical protein
VEEEGISDAMKAVLRAQSKWQGNGKLQDLSQTESTNVQKSVNGNGHKAEPVTTTGDGESLTDQDVENINNIQAEYDARTPEDWQRLLKERKQK